MRKTKTWLQLFRIFGVRQMLRYILDRQAPSNIDGSGDTQNKNINLEKKKIVVYTAIFGRYDTALNPETVDSAIDYVIITDDEKSTNNESVWKPYKNADILTKLSSYDNSMKNRYCKLHPHILFPEYDYSVYLDGNIKIKGDVRVLLSRLEDKKIGIFGHPYRDDTYMEAIAVVKLGNASAVEVKEQMKIYRNEGFPEKYGLFENSILIREHNDEMCKKLMNDWWKELNQYTRRDQLSFMHVLWKNNLTKDYIAKLGDSIQSSTLIERVNHK